MASERVAIPRPGARSTALEGYLARPRGDVGTPAVIVIHEIWGLNDNIRDVARRFAGEGYTALAVDLFSGGRRAVCLLRVLGGLLVRPLDNPGLRDLQLAIEWLVRRPEVAADQLGVIGFCLGGGYALALACVDGQVKAVSAFYGQNPRPLEAVAKSCPIVGSYPERDFTRGAARALEAALDQFGVPHDLKVYPRAFHSFFNDRGRTYQAEAARDSWERTLRFFEIYVRGGSPTNLPPDRQPDAS